ncbi:hypothetical protein Tco_0682573 [Tanacetum coccineum]|uniref:Reverse transcriptase domain-containing protein n=1 Tax=Tanacetum coccineum TaxID=301880 RepID=A0ABQ4XRI1_9ASTR
MEKIFEQVRVNPDIPVKAVQDQLQRELEVQISMSKAFRAKAKAEREIRRDNVLQYYMHRDYVVELQSTNTNTTIKIAVERNTDPSLHNRVFQRIYVCLGALKLSFRAYRREMLGLDGAFMKGPFPSQVFIGLNVGGRDKPVITLLEYIREYCMKRIMNVQGVIDKCTGPLTPTATRCMESIKKEARLMKVHGNGANKYLVSGSLGDQLCLEWIWLLNDRATPPQKTWYIEGNILSQDTTNLWDQVLGEVHMSNNTFSTQASCPGKEEPLHVNPVETLDTIRQHAKDKVERQQQDEKERKQPEGLKASLCSYKIQVMPNSHSSSRVVVKRMRRIEKLADQLSTLVEIVSNLFTPAPVKVVEESCVTCSGPHAWRNLNNDMRSILGSFFQNQASTSGTLPSNTIPNPKGEMKAITTRSGVAYEGPSIPTNPAPKKVVERETEETTDKEQTNFQGSTTQIPPPVIPSSIPEPDVPKTLPKTIPESDIPKSLPKPNIPYPSRRDDQKTRDKALNQMEKIFQIFQDLRFDISFADALLLMPRFAPTIKNLLMNKDKLLELAKIPLNENCSAMLLKKLPEKLGDPGKFLIPFTTYLSNPSPESFETNKSLHEKTTDEPTPVCSPPPGDDDNEKKKQEVKKIAEAKAKRQARITACLKNFRVIQNESIFLDKMPQVSSVFSITSIEPKDSLIMGDEHFSTSRVEEIVPIPRKSWGGGGKGGEYKFFLFNNDKGCDLTSCDDNMIFSNPLLYSKDDLTSSNDDLILKKDIQEEDFRIYSNPLFEFGDNFNSSNENPLFNEMEEDVENENSKVFDEPVLPHTPFSDKVEYSIAWSPENFLASPRSIIESPFHISFPVEDSDPVQEEIDIFTGSDSLTPPGIENDNYDSERDIRFLEELPNNNLIPLPEHKSPNLDHQDNPSTPQPPPEPPDVEIRLGIEYEPC